MKIKKIFQPLTYLVGIYISLVDLPTHRYFFAATFIACLCGFVITTVNLAIESSKK